MPRDLPALAEEVLRAAEQTHMSVAAAESCTGGHIASLLTGAEGLSHMFEAGFVTYSDRAKTDILGISAEDVERYGAVSRNVVRAMASGAVKNSRSRIAVAVSGFTGGAPPGEENGLVHVAVADDSGRNFHRECHFGEVDRDEGRDRAAEAALQLLQEVLAAGRDSPPPEQSA